MSTVNSVSVSSTKSNFIMSCKLRLYFLSCIQRLDSEKSIETTDSVALNADPVVKAISPEKTKDVKKEKQNQVIREAQVKKAIIPLEERMVMFTHLLREKEVQENILVGMFFNLIKKLVSRCKFLCLVSFKLFAIEYKSSQLT